jgi:CheY-like chemotaxis protein
MAHILVIDDQQHVRFLVKRVLETERHAVVEASDGLQALQLLDKMPHVDLILLDLRMPNLDGFEFLALLRLRQVRPPVIILTALWNPDPDFSDDLITDYLFKPFSRQKLLDVVGHHLRARAT